VITPLRISHLYGPDNISAAPDELVVLCLCRDEEYLLPGFLSHYRDLGARHFVFLDNGSVDRTRKIIMDQDDCTLLYSDLPYKVYSTHLKRYLIRRFGHDRWSLIVDADEFFDYPHSDSVSLGSLLSYLDRHGYSAVYTPLLDMYTDRPVKEWCDFEMIPFDRKNFPFYDLPRIREILPSQDTHKRCTVTNERIRLFTGGVKNRVFGTTNVITKHAMTFCRGGQVLLRTDHAVRGAVIADFSGCLFHYKLSGPFVRKAAKYAVEGNYFNDSVWSKVYTEKIRAEGDLTLLGDDTRRFENTNELIENGFMFVSRQYIEELLQSP
jgi:hypothetical protein